MEKVMEQYSNGGPFVMGNQLTCADIFFYPQILNTKNRWKIDLSHLPNT
jgi:glutathione S-transferase